MFSFRSAPVLRGAAVVGAARASVRSRARMLRSRQRAQSGWPDLERAARCAQEFRALTRDCAERRRQQWHALCTQGWAGGGRRLFYWVRAAGPEPQLEREGIRPQARPRLKLDVFLSGLWTAPMKAPLPESWFGLLRRSRSTL